MGGAFLYLVLLIMRVAGALMILTACPYDPITGALMILTSCPYDPITGACKMLKGAATPAARKEFFDEANVMLMFVRQL